MRKILVLLLIVVTGFVRAQELNCVVKVSADQVVQTNRQVFKTLEKSLNEFVNKTKWTNQSFKTKERIDCSMFITITGYNSDQFSGTIQVQSSRPTFNSTYTSPVLNFNDKDFSFRYTEFENLFFDPNSFDSNLISVLAFYSYIIIGMDADTFSPLGGTDYYAQAQGVSSVAQQGSYKGWSQVDGNQNRFFLINDLISTTFSPVRDALYSYHSDGLDKMSEDQKAAKEKIKAAVMSLDKIYSSRPNAFLLRVFFDAKADEISQIFSGGPQVEIADLQQELSKISPINSSKWSAIKL